MVAQSDGTLSSGLSSAIPSAQSFIRKRGKSKTLIECYQLRERIFNDAMAASDPLERARLAQAWELMTERQRILRNRPLPGVRKPSEPRKLGRASAPQIVDVSARMLDAPTVGAQSQAEQSQAPTASASPSTLASGGVGHAMSEGQAEPSVAQLDQSNARSDQSDQSSS